VRLNSPRTFPSRRMIEERKPRAVMSKQRVMARDTTATRRAVAESSRTASWLAGVTLQADIENSQHWAPPHHVAQPDWAWPCRRAFEAYGVVEVLCQSLEHPAVADSRFRVDHDHGAAWAGLLTRNCGASGPSPNTRWLPHQSVSRRDLSISSVSRISPESACGAVPSVSASDPFSASSAATELTVVRA
jgi:hypothetical protein